MARGQRLPELKVLPSNAVPLSAEQREAAIAALVQLFDQWWAKRTHRASAEVHDDNIHHPSGQPIWVMSGPA